MTDDDSTVQSVVSSDDSATGMPGVSVTSVFDWLHQHPPPSQLQLDADGNLIGPTLVGTPVDDVSHWEHQTTSFTCAVEAQRGIIEEFTGKHVSEAQLVYDATIHGWLTNNGTSPSDIGNLLQYYSVPCHTHPQASVEDLVRELSLGHKVIVGVDSGDLWGEHDAFNEFIDHHADHAIWVTGVDFTDAQHPKVIINDSGDPNGGGKAYDLGLFAAAWRHGGFEYCATDDPPPHFADLCAAFDPSVGYFPDLARYFDTSFCGFADTLDATAASGRPAAAGDQLLQLSTTPLENLTDEAQNAIFRAI